MIGLASALYIGANFGAGPRDSLMLAVVHRGAAHLGREPGIQIDRARDRLRARRLGRASARVLFALGLGPCIEGAYWVLVRCGRDAAAARAAGDAGR